MGKTAVCSLIAWLQHRDTKTLTNSDFTRLGFLGDDNAVHQHYETDEKQYQVKRIFYASGKRCGWKNGRLFASEKETGDTRSFLMMQFHTMDVTRASITDLNDICRGIPINSDIEENHGDMKRMQIPDKLKTWFSNNPDSSFHIDGPGNRGSSKKPKISPLLKNWFSVAKAASAWIRPLTTSLSSKRVCWLQKGFSKKVRLMTDVFGHQQDGLSITLERTCRKRSG